MDMFSTFSNKADDKQNDTGKARRATVPYLLVKSLMQFKQAGVKNTIYFQDVLSEVEPFTRIDVELYKPSQKRMPKGYVVPDGSLIVTLEDGKFVGHVSSRDVERCELRPAKTYAACVIPPCDDSTDGFRINDNYNLWIIERI